MCLKVDEVIVTVFKEMFQTSLSSEFSFKLTHMGPWHGKKRSHIFTQKPTSLKHWGNYRPLKAPGTQSELYQVYTIYLPGCGYWNSRWGCASSGTGGSQGTGLGTESSTLELVGARDQQNGDGKPLVEGLCSLAQTLDPSTTMAVSWSPPSVRLSFSL